MGREHQGGANEDSILTDEAQQQRTKKQMYSIKRRIKGYALSNDFKWFATLTINPKTLDSFDYKTAKSTLLKWCRLIRDRYGQFDYLIVPELHKSGAVHFHSLLGNIPANFEEAQNEKTGKSIIRNDRPVYNLKDWKYGFSDCEQIKNPEKTASYMTKYITKELLTDKKMFRKKRYFSSKGLNKPQVNFEMADNEEFSEFTPNFGVIETNEDDQNTMNKAVYNLEINQNNGKLEQNNKNYLIKAKTTKSMKKETIIKPAKANDSPYPSVD